MIPNTMPPPNNRPPGHPFAPQFLPPRGGQLIGSYFLCRVPKRKSLKNDVLLRHSFGPCGGGPLFGPWASQYPGPLLGEGYTSTSGQGAPSPPSAPPRAARELTSARAGASVSAPPLPEIMMPRMISFAKQYTPEKFQLPIFFLPRGDMTSKKADEILNHESLSLNPES